MRFKALFFSCVYVGVLGDCPPFLSFPQLVKLQVRTQFLKACERVTKPSSKLKEHGQTEVLLKSPKTHLQDFLCTAPVQNESSKASQSLQSHQPGGQINASKIPFHFMNRDFLG